MTVKEFEERAKFQEGYDREINHWKIIDVHQIPIEFNEQHEIDFYCSNGENVYLLRLRHREAETFEIVDSENSFLTYLIAELSIQNIDDKLIKSVLNKFTI